VRDSPSEPLKDQWDDLVSLARAGDAKARSDLFEAVLPRIQ